jgi:multisubunit Na+/H+ antiporter MnhG subunit
MTAAFAFVAALSWNQAILALIHEYINAEEDVVSLVVVAIVITIIAVIASLLIARAAAKAKGADEKAGK